MATRYTDKKKAQVVKFVQDYDRKNGRGGQAAAKKKYGINPISIKKWCVEQGVKAPGKSVKKAKKTVANKTTKKKVARGRKPAAKKKTAKANGSKAVTQINAIQKKIKALEVDLNKLKNSL